MVSGTITRVSPSFPNVPAAQYFVVRLRRAALLVVVAALAAGCAGGPAESGPVPLVFKHAKILGPSDPGPRPLRELENRPPRSRLPAGAPPCHSARHHQRLV